MTIKVYLSGVNSVRLDVESADQAVEVAVCLKYK